MLQVAIPGALEQLPPEDGDPVHLIRGPDRPLERRVRAEDLAMSS